MNVLYLLFWPRHSLILPGLLIVVSLLLFFRNRRRVAGLVLALLAIACCTWYATTVWCWHTLPVGHPVKVEIEPLGGSAKPVILRDPAEIAKVTQTLSRVRIKPGCFKVNSEYRLIIYDTDGGYTRYRVSRSGTISHDLPASAIQDVFEPQVPLPSQWLTGPG
jgi:hypothetical protein